MLKSIRLARHSTANSNSFHSSLFKKDKLLVFGLTVFLATASKAVNVFFFRWLFEKNAEAVETVPCWTQQQRFLGLVFPAANHDFLPWYKSSTTGYCTTKSLISYLRHGFSNKISKIGDSNSFWVFIKATRNRLNRLKEPSIFLNCSHMQSYSKPDDSELSANTTRWYGCFILPKLSWAKCSTFDYV